MLDDLKTIPQLARLFEIKADSMSDYLRRKGINEIEPGLYSHAEVSEARAKTLRETIESRRKAGRANGRLNKGLKYQKRERTFTPAKEKDEKCSIVELRTKGYSIMKIARITKVPIDHIVNVVNGLSDSLRNVEIAEPNFLHTWR